MAKLEDNIGEQQNDKEIKTESPQNDGLEKKTYTKNTDGSCVWPLWNSEAAEDAVKKYNNGFAEFRKLYEGKWDPAAPSEDKTETETRGGTRGPRIYEDELTTFDETPTVISKAAWEWRVSEGLARKIERDFESD